MRKMIAMMLSLLFPVAAHAKDVFEWPENYRVTHHETQPGTKNPPFVSIVHKQGRNIRNDISPPINGITTDLFRFEGEKEGYTQIKLHTDGSITKTHRPADWPQSNMFPRHGIWKRLGKDTINGKPAIKFSVDSDPARKNACKYDCPFRLRHTFLWLSPDLKTPLRFKDDPESSNAVVDFTDYAVGPQDPKLFEDPQAKP